MLVQDLTQEQRVLDTREVETEVPREDSEYLQKTVEEMGIQEETVDVAHVIDVKESDKSDELDKDLEVSQETEEGVHEQPIELVTEPPKEIEQEEYRVEGEPDTPIGSFMEEERQVGVDKDIPVISKVERHEEDIKHSFEPEEVSHEIYEAEKREDVIHVEMEREVIETEERGKPCASIEPSEEFLPVVDQVREESVEAEDIPDQKIETREENLMEAFEPSELGSESQRMLQEEKEIVLEVEQPKDTSEDKMLAAEGKPESVEVVEATEELAFHVDTPGKAEEQKQEVEYDLPKEIVAEVEEPRDFGEVEKEEHHKPFEMIQPAEERPIDSETSERVEQKEIDDLHLLTQKAAEVEEPSNVGQIEILADDKPEPIEMVQPTEETRREIDIPKAAEERKHDEYLPKETPSEEDQIREIKEEPETIEVVEPTTEPPSTLDTPDVATEEMYDLPKETTSEVEQPKDIGEVESKESGDMIQHVEVVQPTELSSEKETPEVAEEQKEVEYDLPKETAADIEQPRDIGEVQKDAFDVQPVKEDQPMEFPSERETPEVVYEQKEVGQYDLPIETAAEVEQPSELQSEKEIPEEVEQKELDMYELPKETAAEVEQPKDSSEVEKEDAPDLQAVQEVQPTEFPSERETPEVEQKQLEAGDVDQPIDIDKNEKEEASEEHVDVVQLASKDVVEDRKELEEYELSKEIAANVEEPREVDEEQKVEVGDQLEQTEEILPHEELEYEAHTPEKSEELTQHEYDLQQETSPEVEEPVDIGQIDKDEPDEKFEPGVFAEQPEEPHGEIDTPSEEPVIEMEKVEEERDQVEESQEPHVSDFHLQGNQELLYQHEQETTTVTTTTYTRTVESEEKEDIDGIVFSKPEKPVEDVSEEQVREYVAGVVDSAVMKESEEQVREYVSTVVDSAIMKESEIHEEVPDAVDSAVGKESEKQVQEDVSGVVDVAIEKESEEQVQEHVSIEVDSASTKESEEQVQEYVSRVVDSAIRKESGEQVREYVSTVVDSAIEKEQCHREAETAEHESRAPQEVQPTDVHLDEVITHPEYETELKEQEVSPPTVENIPSKDIAESQIEQQEPSEQRQEEDLGKEDIATVTKTLAEMNAPFDEEEISTSLEVMASEKDVDEEFLEDIPEEQETCPEDAGIEDEESDIKQEKKFEHEQPEEHKESIPEIDTQGVSKIEETTIITEIKETLHQEMQESVKEDHEDVHEEKEHREEPKDSQETVHESSKENVQLPDSVQQPSDSAPSEMSISDHQTQERVITEERIGGVVVTEQFNQTVLQQEIHHLVEEHDIPQESEPEHTDKREPIQENILQSTVAPSHTEITMPTEPSVSSVDEAQLLAKEKLDLSPREDDQDTRDSDLHEDGKLPKGEEVGLHQIEITKETKTVVTREVRFLDLEEAETQESDEEHAEEPDLTEKDISIDEDDDSDVIPEIKLDLQPEQLVEDEDIMAERRARDHGYLIEPDPPTEESEIILGDDSILSDQLGVDEEDIDAKTESISFMEEQIGEAPAQREQFQEEETASVARLSGEFEETDIHEEEVTEPQVVPLGNEQEPLIPDLLPLEPGFQPGADRDEPEDAKTDRICVEEHMDEALVDKQDIPEAEAAPVDAEAQDTSSLDVLTVQEEPEKRPEADQTQDDAVTMYKTIEQAIIVETDVYLESQPVEEPAEHEDVQEVPFLQQFEQESPLQDGRNTPDILDITGEYATHMSYAEGDVTQAHYQVDEPLSPPDAFAKEEDTEKQKEQTELVTVGERDREFFEDIEQHYMVDTPLSDVNVGDQWMKTEIGDATVETRQAFSERTEETEDGATVYHRQVVTETRIIGGAEPLVEGLLLSTDIPQDLEIHAQPPTPDSLQTPEIQELPDTPESSIHDGSVEPSDQHEFHFESASDTQVVSETLQEDDAHERVDEAIAPVDQQEAPLLDGPTESDYYDPSLIGVRVQEYAQETQEHSDQEVIPSAEVSHPVYSEPEVLDSPEEVELPQGDEFNVPQYSEMSFQQEISPSLGYMELEVQGGSDEPPIQQTEEYFEQSVPLDDQQAFDLQEDDRADSVVSPRPPEPVSEIEAQLPPMEIPLQVSEPTPEPEEPPAKGKDEDEVDSPTKPYRRLVSMPATTGDAEIAGFAEPTHKPPQGSVDDLSTHEVTHEEFETKHDDGGVVKKSVHVTRTTFRREVSYPGAEVRSGEAKLQTRSMSEFLVSPTESQPRFREVLRHESHNVPPSSDPTLHENNQNSSSMKVMALLVCIAVSIIALFLYFQARI